MSTRAGFALYLTFVVTTMLFFWCLTGLDIVFCAMDMSRSGALDAVSFQAADGGLEIGLARVKKEAKPFALTLRSRLNPHREVEVTVSASAAANRFDLVSLASVFEGGKLVATRKLVRRGVGPYPGRLECGTFSEES